MPKLYAFRRFFRDEVELAAFDDAKFQDGLVIARRGNEVARAFKMGFKEASLR